MVVASVRYEGVGLASWSAAAARIAGIALTSGMSWVMSLRLPAVNVTASGTPPPLLIRWCFEPVLPRSTGLGPVATPPFSPGHGTRLRTRGTCRSDRRVQFGQQGMTNVRNRVVRSTGDMPRPKTKFPPSGSFSVGLPGN